MTTGRKGWAAARSALRAWLERAALGFVIDILRLYGNGEKEIFKRVGTAAPQRSIRETGPAKGLSSAGGFQVVRDP